MGWGICKDEGRHQEKEQENDPEKRRVEVNVFAIFTNRYGGGGLLDPQIPVG